MSTEEQIKTTDAIKPDLEHDADLIKNSIKETIELNDKQLNNNKNEQSNDNLDNNLIINEDNSKLDNNTDVKQNDKVDDVKQEDVKQEDVKQEDVKQDDIKSDDIKPDDCSRPEEIKSDDIKQIGYSTPDDIKPDDNSKQDDIKTTDEVKEQELNNHHLNIETNQSAINSSTASTDTKLENNLNPIESIDQKNELTESNQATESVNDDNQKSADVPEDARVDTPADTPVDTPADTQAEPISKTNDDQNLLNSVNNQDIISEQQQQINNTDADNQQFIFQSEQDDQALNQQQIILQQTQNPETGEVLFVLQGENGEQIAIPQEAISNGFVQIRDSEGNEQIIALALPNEDGSLAAPNLLRANEANSNLNEQVYLQQQLEVSADILGNLGAASIPTQQLIPTATTASTNVVQSIETPRVSISTQETSMNVMELNNIQTNAKIQDINSSLTNATAQQQLTSIENSNSVNKKVNLVDDQQSINTVTLESIMPTDQLEQLNQADQNNYVIMTADDNQLTNVPGQTFFIETPEGLVACSATAGENGTIQLVQTNDLDSQNQYIIQQTTEQANPQENQLIDSVNGQQPITISLTGNNNEIELLQVNEQQQITSLIDMKNSLQNTSTVKTSKSKSASSKQQQQQHSNIILVPNSSSIENSTSHVKKVQNPTTSKKQNISIIQNISHQPQLNHQPPPPTTASNRKKAQSHHSTKSTYNITVTPSNIKSASNLLSNNEESKRNSFTSQTTNQSHVSSVNKYQQISTASTTNSLASSRKTYSRKNIVWLNPTVNSTTNSTFKTESKDDKPQLKSAIDLNDKKSVTITPIKDNLSSNSQRNSPSPQIKKGTITISTIIDNSKVNQNQSVYNPVKIVPSESQNRLLKNNLPVQTNESTNNNKNTESKSQDDEMQVDVDLPSENKSKKVSRDEEASLDDKPAKRLKRNSFTVEEESKNETSQPPKKSINNDELIVKPESGRRKSPIKPLKDCEMNLYDETKEAKIDLDDDIDNLDEINNKEEEDDDDDDDDDEEEERPIVEIKNKNVSTPSSTSKNLAKQERTRTRSRSESESNQDDNANGNDQKKRRSGRLSKPASVSVTVEAKKEEKPNNDDDDKVVESKVTPKTTLRRGRSSRKSETETNDSPIKEESTTSVNNQQLKGTKKEDKKEIKVEPVKKESKVEPVKKESKVEPVKIEEPKRIDEDSVRFDLLFKSNSNTIKPVNDTQKSKKKNETSTKNAETKSDKQTVLNSSIDLQDDNETNVEPTNTRAKRTRQSSASVNTRSLRSSTTTDNSTTPSSTKKSTAVKKESDSDLNDVQPSTKRRRQTIATIEDKKDKKNDSYDVKLKECEVHVRYQNKLTNTTPKVITTGAHMCQKCGFRTDRINNLILHHKTECVTVKNYYQTELSKYQFRSPSKATTDDVSTAANNSTANNSTSAEISKQRNSEFNDLDDSSKSSDDDDLDKDDLLDSKYEFKVNDIVWVELEEQKVKWPAFVLKIFPYTEQVSIILIDIPKEDRLETTKNLYSANEVISFNNAEQNIRFLEETKSNYDESIVKAVQKAEDYTRKKLLGENLDVNKLLGIRIFPSKTEETSTDKTPKIDNLNLLRYIKSGKVDNQLLGIYNGSIENERHNNYFKAGTKSSANYGPFKNDEEMCEELFNYLKDLLKSNLTKVDDKFDVVQYVFDVWCAEAIIKGMSRLYRLTNDEAEAIFAKYSSDESVS